MKTPEQMAEEVEADREKMRAARARLDAIDAAHAQAVRLHPLNPETTGMDWDELVHHKLEAREDSSHEIAGRILRENGINPPKTDHRYWLLVNAARAGFDARDDM